MEIIKLNGNDRKVYFVVKKSEVTRAELADYVRKTLKVRADQIHVSSATLDDKKEQIFSVNLDNGDYWCASRFVTK